MCRKVGAGRKRTLFSRRKKRRCCAAVVMAFPPAPEKIPCSFQHLMATSKVLGVAAAAAASTHLQQPEGSPTPRVGGLELPHLCSVPLAQP